ncbi:hypothetical protein [Wukongibacter sp. M2B1]
MKKFSKYFRYLLVGTGVLLIFQALATNPSMACLVGAHQNETPDCMK